MNILSKTTGKFMFVTNKYEYEEYDDYRDIPEDLSHIIEVVSFLPDIPPPPHSVLEHELIGKWNQKMKEIMEKVYASRN